MRFTSFCIISAAKCISINTKRSRARQYLHETFRNAASLTMTRLADCFPKIFNPWVIRAIETRQDNVIHRVHMNMRYTQPIGYSRNQEQLTWNNHE